VLHSLSVSSELPDVRFIAIVNLVVVDVDLVDVVERAIRPELDKTSDVSQVFSQVGVGLRPAGKVAK